MRREAIKRVVCIDDEGSGDDENMGLDAVSYCDIKKCPKLITNSLQSKGGRTSNQMGCFLSLGCNKTVVVPGTTVSYLEWNRELTLKCKLKCYLNP